MSKKSFSFPSTVIAILSVIGLMVGVFADPSFVRAASSANGDEKLITIHDRDSEKSLITHDDTLREIFDEADILIDTNDIVEPGLDETLVGNNYHVNIYRARPITIVDGATQLRVMSAHQTPEQIAEQAGFDLQDEDEATMTTTNNVLADGLGLRLVIDRATPVNLILYGQKEKVYTQAATVDELLEEKSIELAKKDTLTVSKDTAISQNMKIEIWRNGKQTITVDEAIAFPVERIQDANREAGYHVVKTPGAKGKKTVTYEIVMKNGKELKRKTIQSVVTKQPKKQVEIVGAKPSFSGDFASALAKLRSCEGGYSSWNPAGPYYGAYQFDRGTWASVADPAKYGNASPAEQDAAAHKLYLRRGWSPWPHCGASLPDTYR